MRNIFIIIIIISLSIYSLEIGEKVHIDYKNKPRFRTIIDPYGNSYYKLDTIIDNLKFTLGYNDSLLVKYYSTNDKNFQTEEGYKIGYLYKDLSDSIKNSRVYLPGVGNVLKLDSHWYCMIGPIYRTINLDTNDHIFLIFNY